MKPAYLKVPGKHTQTTAEDGSNRLQVPLWRNVYSWWICTLLLLLQACAISAKLNELLVSFIGTRGSCAPSEGWILHLCGSWWRLLLPLWQSPSLIASDSGRCGPTSLWPGQGTLGNEAVRNEITDKKIKLSVVEEVFRFMANGIYITLL